MANSKKAKEILEQIDIEKEVLSTLPKNNPKNIAKYNRNIEELENKYQNYQSEINRILTKRYEKLVNVEKNENIEKLEENLKIMDSKLYLLNDNMTSYEKMKLDQIIYDIEKYYKKNFENINKKISECLEIFENVGTKLELSDFYYSIYVKQYMKIFLQEYKSGNTNSERLKEKFEEIFWKCPDIIVHIELNIREIYLKKETQINKYFEKEKAYLLKEWNIKLDEAKDKYFDLKREKMVLQAKDKRLMLEEFMSGKLNVKDYSKEKLTSDCRKVFSDEFINSLDGETTELEINILKFINTLNEYKNYMTFKFIIDDIKQYYNEKEKYKKVYVLTKKNIDKAEGKLKSLNKKLTNKSLFKFKKSNTKVLNEQNSLILELKNLYKELDLNKFYNKIYTNLDDTSTLEEVLNLANSYYNYLVECMKKSNSEITHEEISEKIKLLDEFLKTPYNTIIRNLTISEEKDIATIIKDRYMLLNFVIEKEDLEIDNIDNLISLLEEINRGFTLKRLGLKIENIEMILELKKILKIKY